MPLGTVPTGFSSNCTFGGGDRKTLYVAARTLLKAVPHDRARPTGLTARQNALRA
jgi:sugar lactone lactonase YvrE